VEYTVLSFLTITSFFIKCIQYTSGPDKVRVVSAVLSCFPWSCSVEP